MSVHHMMHPFIFLKLVEFVLLYVYIFSKLYMQLRLNLIYVDFMHRESHFYKYLSEFPLVSCCFISSLPLNRKQNKTKPSCFLNKWVLVFLVNLDKPKFS